ncbi:unnamed protein product [Cuscuta campestris]|uniref:GAG-pre-integrase domain-containing protein n=1 Tax=Cuscuta campestris TaxID=132261 RepID=A0A484N6H4_9ASTE|nr:unnamed protein product [Cuscuta campestris]VFQ95838.1 unnamed protein product [Cuscuta campestris]
MDHLNKLVSKDLVIGVPKLKFEKNLICDACQKGKQVLMMMMKKSLRKRKRKKRKRRNKRSFLRNGEH